MIATRAGRGLLLGTALLASRLAAQEGSGLSLQQALARALERYPTVAAARASREAAGAGVGEARAALFPRLSTDISVVRYQEPFIVYPLHGFDLRNPPLFDRTLTQGSLGLAYTVFDFGARASRIRLARAKEGRAGAALDAAEAALIARVANAYLRVLTVQSVLAAQRQRITALEGETARARRLLEAGRAARVEVLRVDAELSRARADAIATEAQLDVAERELAQLAQLPADSASAPRLAPLRLADTSFAENREARAARARSASPDIGQARRSADAAAAAAGAARATRLPELRLQAAYVDRGRGSGDFKAEWNAGLALSYPLFTGGSRESTIRRTEAEARAAAQQLRLAEQTVEQALDRTLAAVREARARVEALALAAATSEEVARIERLSLQAGMGTQTDYLDAEATLLRSRASLIEARHTEISARIELARVIGELTPEWIARELREDRRTDAQTHRRTVGEP